MEQFTIGYSRKNRKVYLHVLQQYNTYWFTAQEAVRVANALLEAKNRVDELDTSDEVEVARVVPENPY